MKTRKGDNRRGSNPLNKELLQRIITGALRDTLNAHGKIGPAQIGSAAKRISGSLDSNFQLHRRLPKTKHRTSGDKTLALTN